MERLKMIIAGIVSVMAISAAVPMNIYADDASGGTDTVASENTTEEQTEPETVMHTVTFLDFDGNKMAVLNVPEGGAINYKSVDTSVLRKHLDKFTEQEFSQWSSTPETAQTDLTIKALYRKATLNIENSPSKHRYIYADGDVDTSGLKASVTIETQLPETDNNGAYKVSSSTIDISESCTAKPKTLAEAFSGGKTEAVIEIFPIGDNKPLTSYSIELLSDIGDVTRDGRVDAVDASAILRAYADLNSESHKAVSSDILKYGDINEDGFVDPNDASLVLRFYVMASAHKKADWREIAGIK